MHNTWKRVLLDSDSPLALGKQRTQQGVDGVHSLLSDLKSCSARRDLQRGRRIHAKAVKYGTSSDMYVATALVKMYAKCGSIADARRVFQGIRKPDLVCWTALVLGYANNGEGLAALETFSNMKARGCTPDSFTYVAALKACTALAIKGEDKKGCLARGRAIHLEIGRHLDQYVQGMLIDMYSKCGSMPDALRVFDSIPKPDVVCWTALLLGYADNGEGLVALQLFSRMKAQGCAPNSVTYVAALKACTSLAKSGNDTQKLVLLERGREIHSEISCPMELYLQNTLIDMYTNCGSMVDARCVFDSIVKPDVVSWNSLLMGHAENGESHIVMDLFSRMKAHGLAPDSVTYVALLKACSQLAFNRNTGAKRDCLELGKVIHSEIGSHSNLYVRNTLIDMYATCGSMTDARRVFDTVEKPDVVSWNVLLLGYAENGEGLAALDLFSRMKAQGCPPNVSTHIASLKACISLAANGNSSAKEESLKRGRELHSGVANLLDPHLQVTLIDMYAKCGSMSDARLVFANIPKPDVLCWTALMLGYAEIGEGLVTLELFSRMKAQGCSPSSVTYVAAVKACTWLAVTGGERGRRDCLERGREIHSEIGCHLNCYVQNTLMDMYSKCGSMAEVRRVFDSIQTPDVVSWNVLILGYADNGQALSALNLFSKMKARGCAPSSVTYIAAIKACTSLGEASTGSGKEDYLARGRDLHSEAGSHLDPFVKTALIDMYANCGSMVDARRVFDGVQKPDVVSWNALLLGYAENGEGHVVLDLFSGMKAHGCIPNSVTYIAAFKACSSTGELALGRRLHSQLTEFTSPLVTCLVDFYAKCGSMVEAREVFDCHARARGVPTWNALIAGYGSFCDTDSVFQVFEAMLQCDKLRPSSVTFVCLLLCCSHAGLVEKAREYFEAMPASYGISPTLMHYTCVVDVLGRANQMNEALAVLRRMPFSPDVVIWTVLLGACHKWKNVEVGRMAFQALVGMDKGDASSHVLMAHLYDTRSVWKRMQFGAWRLHSTRHAWEEYERQVN